MYEKKVLLNNYPGHEYDKNCILVEIMFVSNFIKWKTKSFSNFAVQNKIAWIHSAHG